MSEPDHTELQPTPSLRVMRVYRAACDLKRAADSVQTASPEELPGRVKAWRAAYAKLNRIMGDTPEGDA